MLQRLKLDWFIVGEQVAVEFERIIFCNALEVKLIDTEAKFERNE